MKEAEVTGAQFTDVQMVTHDNSLITDAQFAGAPFTGAQFTSAQTDTQDDSMITGAQITGTHFTGAPEAELLKQKHLE